MIQEELLAPVQIDTDASSSSGSSALAPAAAVAPMSFFGGVDQGPGLQSAFNPQQNKVWTKVPICSAELSLIQEVKSLTLAFANLFHGTTQ